MITHTINRVTVHEGDCLQSLRAMPDECVDCCVTSPPYWGLRDYGHEGQYGLEQTLRAYIDQMVMVFQQVRRVLKSDGTLWLNIGDSYFVGNGELKPKDLCGIPWRLALALQAEGWWLRQDIIWHKPNPMPESTKDRCTKAHEYVFLLSKSDRYYFDSKAMQEPAMRPAGSGNKQRKAASERGVPADTDGKTSGAVAGSVPWAGETRNRRSVWTIAAKPYPGAHFAVMPEELATLCVNAGCREGGVVLDPFGGSGTVGVVARKSGCDAVLCELNPEYIAQIKDRLKQGSLL